MGGCSYTVRSAIKRTAAATMACGHTGVGSSSTSATAMWPGRPYQHSWASRQQHRKGWPPNRFSDWHIMAANVMPEVAAVAMPQLQPGGLYLQKETQQQQQNPIHPYP